MERSRIELQVSLNRSMGYYRLGDAHDQLQVIWDVSQVHQNRCVTQLWKYQDLKYNRVLSAWVGWHPGNNGTSCLKNRILKLGMVSVLEKIKSWNICSLLDEKLDRGLHRLILMVQVTSMLLDSGQHEFMTDLYSIGYKYSKISGSSSE